MAELRIEGLAKTFRKHPVLSGVDLVVSSGELIAVLGASGSGKSTLLRLVAGFEQADAGTIDLDGRRMCGAGVHAQPERRRIGYVAQEGALFPHLSVARNVVFGLPISQRKRRRADAMLESVGLPASYGDRAPHELSGGEQQRVALARALAPSPSLVLLDEPFSALDASLRGETREAVVAALAGAGATALLVTHDQSEALSVGHRVAVLRDGRLAQVATPATLYRKPVDADLARFVGEAVLLPGQVDAGSVVCRLGRLSLAIDLPDGPAEVMVRPEQIRLLTRPQEGSIRAQVLSLTFYGHDASLLLRIGGDADTVTARVAGHALPRPGEDIWLQVETAVMAYPRRIERPVASSHAL